MYLFLGVIAIEIGNVDVRTVVQRLLTAKEGGLGREAGIVRLKAQRGSGVVAGKENQSEIAAGIETGTGKGKVYT